MKLIVKISCILFFLLGAAFSNAQTSTDDVFIPLSKYISQGNTEALSAWFDDNLEVNIMSHGGMSSKAQAKQIIKSFFRTHMPESFQVNHTAGRSNMKYILADLKAGGESYHVILFLNSQSGTYRIQQIKIDKI
ncbi:MAG: DUF4783 domain-containing protein [Bacteroidales bacterium]|nr:DUF4783 domain-containing protein [Bacteroidales bacterium]